MSSSEHVLNVQAEPEMPPFRSEIRSVIGEMAPGSVEFTGLRSVEVKVSEHRLEKYLNPSNPTCSG